MLNENEIHAEDVFEISVIPHSDVEDVYIENLEIIEWIKTYLILKINFKDESQLSKGLFRDELKVDIAKPEMFMSASGEILEYKVEYNTGIPKQFPEGVEEESLKAAAKSVQTTFNAVFIIQLLSQLILKKSMSVV